MDPQLTGWPALAMLACVLVSYALRRFTPSTGRWHTGGGAFVLALVTAVLSATAQAIQAHGLALASIESAAIGAVLSLLATSNPSLLPPLKVFIVGMLFVGIAGCASAQYDTMVGEYTLARAEGLGIKAFNEADKTKMAGFYDQYVGGDHDGAAKGYMAYKPKQQKALAAFNSADHLMHAADEVRDGAVKGARDWKDFFAYLPQFGAAAQDIIQALSDLGIHIGGGK